MKNCKNANLVLFYPVRDQERRARNDQLACTSHTSITSRKRVAREDVHGIPDMVCNFGSCGLIIGRNEFVRGS